MPAGLNEITYAGLVFISKGVCPAIRKLQEICVSEKTSRVGEFMGMFKYLSKLIPSL